MTRLALGFSVLLLSLAVAGCGELPRPFKPAVKSATADPFLALRDSPGVVVAPLAAAAPPVAGPLADLTAAALREVNVPATTDGAIAHAFLLEGTVDTPPSAVGQEALLVLSWTISDVHGRAIATPRTVHTLSPASWDAGDPVALQRVAADAAREIALAFDRPPPPADTSAALPTLAVAAVEGAPGDGNSALKTAFEAVLRRAGVAIARDADTADVHVRGTVTAAPPRGETQQVEIVWTMATRDGAALGVLRQKNAVGAGTLDGRWGQAAFDVAVAAADGVAAILAEVDVSTRPPQAAGSPAR